MLKKLIKLTIENPLKLSYINLNTKNQYKGWVTDFGLIYKPTQEKISLNLNNEIDLFLLFVLASSWSKTGPWENALFFTAYLKYNYDFKSILNKKTKLSKNSPDFIKENYVGINSRKKISFRKDFYDSVEVLIDNWDDIKKVLQISESLNNWKIFIEYISSLNGLGARNNKMQIKIPFILRELRCQNVYSNIDGKYCCIADERVISAYKSMRKSLPTNYLEASKKIYRDFGDLYDIPAFAYIDFAQNNLI